MSGGKVVGYVVSAILIVVAVPWLFCGGLWLLSAFSEETADPKSRLTTGVVLFIIGVVLIGAGVATIALMKMREPKPEQRVVVEQKIDFSGDIELEKLQCKNCGAELDKSSITLAQGAVIVSCPYCGTSYQMVEEPKW